MSMLIIFFDVLIFALVFLLSYVAMNTWWPNARAQRMASLKTVDAAPGSGAAAKASAWRSRMQRWVDWLSPLSMAADADGAQPLQASGLRRRLFNAGVHSPSAPAVYLASKTVLTFLLPLLAGLVLWQSGNSWTQTVQMAAVMLCAVIGYYLPDLWLARRTKSYQRALFNAFPDALDLMRVCVQAGLGLDAAIDRVGREMRLSCPELSNEFALTSLELRAGAARSDALRHLSQRMGLDDLDALVVMLIQADRLGTSVTESLQVHSDALRSKRRFRAEEAAAKLPVKLLIPLVFCVFPALLTVLLGPAVISVHEILAPTARSG